MTATKDKSKARLTIVVPVFNEADNLPEIMPGLIDHCERNNTKIIVVDDGSTDESNDILNSYRSRYLEIFSHKINRGYGAALKTGIMNVKTDYSITFDADGQHVLEDIGHLMKCMEENDADMVVGSRKGQVTASRSRQIGKWIIRAIARILIKVPIYDLNSGLKLFDTRIAQKYINLYPDTMAFSNIITLVFLSEKYKVMEHPISIKKRKGGKSTVNVHTAFDTVMEIINIVVLFNPMKIFLPISILSFLVGFIWGLPIMLRGKGVSVGASLLIIASLLSFLLGLLAEQLSQIRKKI